MKKLFLYMTAMLLMIGGIHPAAAMDANLFEDVQIHGFIAQGFLYSDEYNYLAHNSTDGSFEYNEMGINFSKNMSDKLRIGLQFFSRDLGDANNNKVTLDWAYGDYRFQDWLGIRAGKIKLPLGLYNETRDVDMLRTNIVMPQGIYSDFLRDTTIALSGFGLYGSMPMGAAGNLDYQALAGSFSNENESGLGKYTNSMWDGLNLSINSEYDYETGYCGSLRWDTALDGFKLGYSTLTTKADTDIILNHPTLGAIPLAMASDFTFQIVSAEYVWNNLTLAAEYLLRVSKGHLPTRTTRVEHESYYLSAAYRFNDLFTLGAFYSESYRDKNDKDGDDLAANRGLEKHDAWEKDLAVTFRFDLTGSWVAKVEGHSVNGTYNVLTADNPDKSEESFYYGVAKLTFSF